MQTILCATDFSRPAAKVCRYAALMAKQINARLCLLHAVHPTFRYSPDMQAMEFDDDHLQGYYANKLKRLARRLQKFVGEGLSVEVINKTGFAVDVIAQVSTELKPDLLVMSTVGQLPRSSEIMGNVSSEMTRKASVPLMLIPPKAEFKPFENVYMAIDVSKKVDAVAFQQMIDALKAFRVVINIFSVVPDPESEQVKAVVLKLREMLREYPHVIDVVKGRDFVGSFLENAQTYKADLMIVFPKQHNWVELWFRGTNTEKLLFKTDLPLITIA